MHGSLHAAESNHRSLSVQLAALVIGNNQHCRPDHCEFLARFTSGSHNLLVRARSYTRRRPRVGGHIFQIDAVSRDRLAPHSLHVHYDLDCSGRDLPIELRVPALHSLFSRAVSLARAESRASPVSSTDDERDPATMDLDDYRAISASSCRNALYPARSIGM